jgi:RHS repeat-associated protein
MDGARCGATPTAMSVSANCANLPTGSTGDVYNALGQLCWTGTTTSTQAGCGTGATRGTSLVYDGQGLLTSSTSTTGSTTTNASYAFDTQSGSVPRMLTDGTNAYVYGPLLFGGSAPVEQINLATKQVDLLVAAPSGVQAIFTGATTAAIQQESAYSAFGIQTLQQLGAGLTGAQSPFGFDGAYTIPSTGGLLYLDHRFYDPGSDQFLSVDPAIAQTGQAYAFAGDNPLNATDPLGLAWYCMQGTTHWYNGNAYVSNGTCGFGEFGQYCYWGDANCTSSARWATQAQATAFDEAMVELADEKAQSQSPSTVGGILSDISAVAGVAGIAADITAAGEASSVVGIEIVPETLGTSLILNTISTGASCSAGAFNESPSAAIQHCESDVMIYSLSFGLGSESGLAHVATAASDTYTFLRAARSWFGF